MRDNEVIRVISGKNGIHAVNGEIVRRCDQTEIHVKTLLNLAVSVVNRVAYDVSRNLIGKHFVGPDIYRAHIYAEIIAVVVLFGKLFLYSVPGILGRDLFRDLGVRGIICCVFHIIRCPSPA